MNLRRYLVTLSTGRLILWCYFIWYLVVLVKYFDSSASLWLTSLGLSVIIGFALYLSTSGSGTTRVKLDRWQLFRLFLMPFCVSSFAALVKGKNFVLIFSPVPQENWLAVALCTALCLIVLGLKRMSRRASVNSPSPPRLDFCACKKNGALGAPFQKVWLPVFSARACGG